MVSTSLHNARLNGCARVKRAEPALHLVADNAPRKINNEKIAVIGLGYVGLPLAVRLAERFERVAGFDISDRRVDEICSGLDASNEVDEVVLRQCGLMASTDPREIAEATFYIVTVPTPIDAARQPDLAPLISACEIVGEYLSKGDVVVFESTVYPGATEEVCAPILERISKLKLGTDFGLGYSPERINPGDKVNTVNTVVKVVSADNDTSLQRVKAVYGTVIDAGLYAAPNIKVAEASKVLENTQRDINIALMNEMSMICEKVGISTHDVIEAASTKWNFVPMTPGLVGGHCIGVDPYYLAALAEKVGHNPQLIMAGRRTNEAIVRHTADSALRALLKQGGAITDKRVAVCGITFKENVPDMRNSKALEMIEILRSFGVELMVHDPHCDPDEAASVGVALCRTEVLADLDMLILTAAHREYLLDDGFLDRVRDGGILMDVKGAYRTAERRETMTYWSL
ncbi:nucleotide sugar dehydrogenase [Mameliella alba]|nr:nucleotide sugar dehydrogenase [Mameliella alba]MBY6172664.1 nucleotide sugar dehydrogenase [Mameliella alba]MBY6177646.1 nucleotide sugar dehydrogenase [Mameliella alba]